MPPLPRFASRNTFHHLVKGGDVRPLQRRFQTSERDLAVGVDDNRHQPFLGRSAPIDIIEHAEINVCRPAQPT